MGNHKGSEMHILIYARRHIPNSIFLKGYSHDIDMFLKASNITSYNSENFRTSTLTRILKKYRTIVIFIIQFFDGNVSTVNKTQ
jgi:hypothetical protein